MGCTVRSTFSPYFIECHIYCSCTQEKGYKNRNHITTIKRDFVKQAGSTQYNGAGSMYVYKIYILDIHKICIK